ncbi:hypothetical protein [Trinickia sp. EG282A]|uniref:hypothetical protein n=1 Tax=Trinickia sp. EG282A TaxID=3237013 RepID=UPI0034D2AFF5
MGTPNAEGTTESPSGASGTSTMGNGMNKSSGMHKHHMRHMKHNKGMAASEPEPSSGSQ